MFPISTLNDLSLSITTCDYLRTNYKQTIVCLYLLFCEVWEWFCVKLEIPICYRLWTNYIQSSVIQDFRNTSHGKQCFGDLGFFATKALFKILVTTEFIYCIFQLSMLYLKHLIGLFLFSSFAFCLRIILRLIRVFYLSRWSFNQWRNSFTSYICRSLRTKSLRFFLLLLRLLNLVHLMRVLL